MKDEEGSGAVHSKGSQNENTPKSARLTVAQGLGQHLPLGAGQGSDQRGYMVAALDECACSVLFLT